MFGEIGPSGSPSNTSMRESTSLASLAQAVAEFLTNSSAPAAPTEPRRNSRRLTMTVHLAWKNCRLGSRAYSKRLLAFVQCLSLSVFLHQRRAHVSEPLVPYSIRLGYFPRALGEKRAAKSVL